MVVPVQEERALSSGRAAGDQRTPRLLRANLRCVGMGIVCRVSFALVVPAAEFPQSFFRQVTEDFTHGRPFRQRICPHFP